MCMCVYNYVLTPTIHAAVSVLSVHRSTTRNTPWTRPAARHRTSLLPRARSPENDPSTSLPLAPPSFTGSRHSRFFRSSAVLLVPFFSSFVRLTLFLSFRYSSLPHPPCYRVQGQPIEGNFLVPIAFVRLPRTIRFVSFPFFILANHASFFHVILSPFSSHLYSSTSLSLFYSTESFYKFEKDDARTVEKSIDGNWSATHSTVDKLDRTC